MAIHSSSTVQDLQWDDVGREAVRLLSRYIRIDTSNPPGSEGEAAKFLAEVLSAEGIDATVREAAPGRPNLVARQKAAGPSAPALLLLHHMDVVPAPASAWSVPPFDGVVRDGAVWGRGAIDDKGLGTVHLMAFLLLNRLGIPLRRDVVLMAVADEEQGGGHGTKWMIDNHWPEIECEYVWDEGGAGTRGIIGSRPTFAVAVSEKRSMPVRLTAGGRGGHGSMAAGTPVDRLVRALHALQGLRAEARFSDVTREFLRRIAPTQRFPASWMLRHADSPAIRPMVARRLASIPSVNAMLRDTVAATMLTAGETANVAPEQAHAILGTRLLPDTDGTRFVDAIRRAINDESISVEAAPSPPGAAPSPVDSAMFRAFERAIEASVPDAIVTPVQTPVATDSRFFRERGVKAYGLVPVVLTQEELGAVHGVDERLSVQDLTLGVKIALDVILDLCA